MASSNLLRVFVGTSPNGEDLEAYLVAEHSLRRRASVDVSVEALCVSRDLKAPTGGWMTERWSTPWTALRWAVPEICGYRGRAIYFDCPTLVLGDVAELARAPVPDKAFVLLRRTGRTLATACAVFDCERARKYLPTVAEMRRDVGAHQSVGHLLERHPVAVGPLPNGWGASDAEFSRAPGARWSSVHFASAYMQPHLAHARRRLAREGRQHWFEEVLLPHYCPALVGMFSEEYAMTRDREAAE